MRIAYDDGAIYMAARMYDSEPNLVRSRLGRRDSDPPADEFRVDFDSYHDHRTAFGFGVNAAGVRRDAAYANDVAYGDLSWDPVWEVATRRDSLGWAAEMRIPLSQLRFASALVQVWGVHFRRWIHHKAESADFGWSAQTDNGFASWFGHLHGLEGLPQPRRLEVLPYVTATEERIDPGADDNPFNDGSRERLNGGLDLKYGLTSNLTLDATVNPDFGQVEADPALVNLTAFESFFPERRPFFVEGGEIFRFGEGGPSASVGRTTSTRAASDVHRRVSPAPAAASWTPPRAARSSAPASSPVAPPAGGRLGCWKPSPPASTPQWPRWVSASVTRSSRSPATL